MKEIYSIQVLKDNISWVTVAEFSEGQRSRFDKPFDATVAVMELKSFDEEWQMITKGRDLSLINKKDFTKTRLIIELI